MWFAHEHIEFRQAEMQSILSMYNIPMRWVEQPSHTKPYWIVEFQSEETIHKIASRSITLKNCIEIWSRAKTIAQLHKNMRQSLHNETEDWITATLEKNLKSSEYDICPKHLISKYFPEGCSFKINVETFCKHFSMPEKIRKIEEFSYLPLLGPVQLQKPDVEMMYLEFYGTDPNNIPDEPYDVFFGRWITEGQRNLMHKLSLKTRKFIGNTSMDPQLSLIMANQAQVQNGSLVIDPFVGSGSLLVAAAEFGGYVLGSDIDFLMLHARTRPSRVKQKVREKDESIKANMKQYGTHGRYLDVFVNDFSLPVIRDDVQFDAIITDPPYGVREPTERIGIERENYALANHHLANHIPAKVDYGLAHIFTDIMNFAARHLGEGKRLVMWYPLVRSDYKEEDLPSHPQLELVGNSEQILSKLTGRRLLTFQRIGSTGPATTLPKSDSDNDFRMKYFALGDATRKERKERRAEVMSRNSAERKMREGMKNGDCDDRLS